MKSLIVAICIFVVASGQFDKLKESINQNLEECKDIVGASDEDADQFKHRVTPDSTAGKCLIACVNKKFNIQDADGKFSDQSAVELEKHLEGLDEEIRHAILDINEKCLKEVNDGPDECETAAQWFTCTGKGKLEANIPLFLVDE